MNDFTRFVPLIVVLAAAFILGMMMMPPGEQPGRMNIYEFGCLPVVDGGRVKPMDTFARNTLFSISDRQTYVDENGDTQPAIQWLLDVISSRPATAAGGTRKDASTPAWFDFTVFQITNDQVLQMLGLPERSGFHYSIREIVAGAEDTPRKDNLPRLMAAAAKSDERKADLRDDYDNKVMELARSVMLFRKLLSQQTPLILPPETTEADWRPFDDAVLEDGQPDPSNANAVALKTIYTAYGAGKVDAFNDAVSKYKDQVGTARGAAEMDRIGFEAFFNYCQPFYVCMVIYLCVFLMACFSWVGWTEPLRRSAFWLCLLTLAIHTFALFSRMYLLNRPLVFVTNLYSSAIFIGWGAVGLGLVLESFFPTSIGTVVGSVVGFLSLIVAHNIAAGDTLEMMQAVLDTNFWLATHVTCVTIGYLSTLVAGFLGIVFIVMGLFTRALTRPAMKMMTQMLYGIICFAMLFSFTGTVLGGIWADQSWGRFWGWDPKENGALLIVIWNALILHARWAGMVKQRGLAVLAVVGNIVTSWSWFGTNMLGIGLHAYGGNQTARVAWLLTFIGFDLGMIALGTLPLRMWKSFATLPEVPVAPDLSPAPRISGKGHPGIQPT